MNADAPKEQLTSENFQVKINDVDLDGIDLQTVYLDYNEQHDMSDIYFLVDSKDVKVNDSIKVYYKDNLEVDGKVIQVVEKDGKLQVIGATVKEVKYRWRFLFINNWNKESIIFLSSVHVKGSMYGFILFNFGFYIAKTQIMEKKEETQEIPKQ